MQAILVAIVQVIVNAIIAAIGRRVASKEEGGGYVLTIAQIKSVQQALADRGLYPADEVDGKWGPKSKAAVMRLQAEFKPPERQTGTLTPRVQQALGVRFGPDA